TAADLIKLAMIAVQRWIDERRLGTRLVLQVHDELVFEVPEDEVRAATELVEREMTSVCEMKVPLGVESSTGATWAEAKG
ncbi:MAG: DNA polymerase, partial [Actinomycetota bacterium]